MTILQPSFAGREPVEDGTALTTYGPPRQMESNASPSGTPGKATGQTDSSKLIRLHESIATLLS
ncbi:MAG TPA: hypothetical protein VGM75_30550, partial [Pseudonocardiaceae bacterium]